MDGTLAGKSIRQKCKKINNIQKGGLELIIACGLIITVLFLLTGGFFMVKAAKQIHDENNRRRK
jgi:hypothetical protein